MEFFFPWASGCGKFKWSGHLGVLLDGLMWLTLLIRRDFDVIGCGISEFCFRLLVSFPAKETRQWALQR